MSNKTSLRGFTIYNLQIGLKLIRVIGVAMVIILYCFSLYKYMFTHLIRLLFFSISTVTVMLLLVS